MSWFQKLRYRLAKMIIHFVALRLSYSGTVEYCLATAKLYHEHFGDEDDA